VTSDFDNIVGSGSSVGASPLVVAVHVAALVGVVVDVIAGAAVGDGGVVDVVAAAAVGVGSVDQFDDDEVSTIGAVAAVVAGAVVAGAVVAGVAVVVAVVAGAVGVVAVKAGSVEAPVAETVLGATVVDAGAAAVRTPPSPAAIGAATGPEATEPGASTDGTSSAP
jgi:hypothetical protein